MPELAEVEYYRHQWDKGLDQKVLRTSLHLRARVFRGTDPRQIASSLTGSIFRSSKAHGKQMLLRFNRSHWLGIHLGMTGELRTEPPDFEPRAHDHLVIFQKKQALVFSDHRLFGRIRFDSSEEPPSWWKKLPPSLLSKEFTVKTLAAARKRFRRAPLKAFLLRQDLFPGIGNWMADEILWRSRLHPAKKTGDLSDAELKALHRETRYVCRHALRIIGKYWGDLPDSWLFNHRWENGGLCPRTGMELKRETIGGRTTCWSPAWQKLS